jgi:hypothetical protein
MRPEIEPERFSSLRDGSCALAARPSRNPARTRPGSRTRLFLMGGFTFIHQRVIIPD